MNLLKLAGILCLFTLCANTHAQDTTHYNYGIWQTFGDPVSPEIHPEVNGRLCNFKWADIETSPNVWQWAQFDSNLAVRAKDTLPIIFMVYTEEDAPDWLYTNGVQKVIQKNESGTIITHSPYFAGSAYKSYFKRMITKVREHVEALPDSIRNQIIAVQACLGSTGDNIGYKGIVAPQYELTGADFYELYKEFSAYYYNEYKNASPKIFLLSNPGNAGDDECQWLIDNCPGSWIKTGSLGKGYQLNDEVTKAQWLYNILNKPQNGHYMRARSEIIGSASVSGWWTKNPYKNMFAMLCYDIYWGLDWSNQGADQINEPLFKQAFNFYNKYAGQKDPSKSSNAMCALRDGLDASDINRFPVNAYGAAGKTTARFNKVLATFKTYGAKLEDPASAVATEADNLLANGINDVGWNIFTGNYDRYLHQINPNGTSAGYWNVQSSDNNTMYGRFARGFDVANGKTALYFDVDSAFLNNSPLDKKYKTMIEVTYFDNGYGSWQLFYDAKKLNNKPSLSVTCTNTQVWKKASVTISDAYFYNRAENGSDFYIKSTNNENVIFAVVELARPKEDFSNVGLSAPAGISFDTLCVNSTSAAKAFRVSGAFLNGSNIIVKPLKGFSFSNEANGIYLDSLVIKDYGASFFDSVYIKFNPTAHRSYNGSLVIKGSGFKIPVNVVATGVSTPSLTATINNITCNNDKNGSINLNTKGGAGIFTYSWAATVPFKSFTKDVSNLIPATYTVTINSAGGCIATASYTVTQPDELTVNLSADKMTCKAGTTQLYVAAAGGTQPYSGTGQFTVDAGFKVYYVTDRHGCIGKGSMAVANGTLVEPNKPQVITSTAADATGLCGGGNFNFAVDAMPTATTYTWMLPNRSSITSAINDSSKITLNAPADFTATTLAVTANNVCGSSIALVKNLYAVPGRPGAITGPATASPSQTNLVYKVPPAPGVSYLWNVPPGSEITLGQNTSTIKVTWGSRAGNVSVKAINSCGESANISSLYVSLAGNQALNNITASFFNTTAQNVFAINPNPVKDVAQLTYHANNKGKVTIELTDITGKLLTSKTVDAGKGQNTTNIYMSNYAKGMYIVSLRNGKGERKTIKVIKE